MRAAASVVVAVLALAGAVLFVPAVQATAQSTTPAIVIDFEDGRGETLTTQYARDGVTFDPEVVVESRFSNLARSPKHVVTPGPRGCERYDDPYVELNDVGPAMAPPPPGRVSGATQTSTPPSPCQPLTMKFTNPTSRVKVWVGYATSLCGGGELRLNGFDAAGKSVGTDVARLPASQPPQKVDQDLEVVASRPMARARLGVVDSASPPSCNASDGGLLVDDIELEAPAATVEPSAVDFGQVATTGTGATRSVQVKSTGLTDLVVQRPPALTNTQGDEFSVVREGCSQRRVLPPGSACTIEVRFRPREPGQRSATLLVPTNDPRGPASVAVKGTGETTTTLPASTATVTPDRIDFGAARVGTAGATRMVTVGAAEDGPPVEVARLGVEPPTGDFSLVEAGCAGTTLKAGTSCVVELRFRPSAVGARDAVLEVTAGSPPVAHRVSLAGTGTAGDVASASFAPDPLDFGAATLGQAPATVTLTVSNSGTAPLVVSSLAVAGEHRRDFSVGASRCSGARVAPQQTCTVDLAFRPTATGRRTATLAVSTNAGDSPHQVALAGTAVAVAGEVVTRPELRVDPGAGDRGAPIGVAGSGFSGRTELTWHSQEPGTRLAVVVPDDQQRIDLTVTVPADATPGGHEVVACDARGSCARAPFSVELATSPVATGGRGRLVLLLVGLVLMAVLVPGVAAVRRRWTPPAAAAGPPPPTVPEEPAPPGYGGGGRDRPVHTGFAPAGDYHAALDPSVPLEPGRPYHFWLELGAAVASVPGARADLTVALFDYPGELEIDAAADTGELELRGDGSAVARQGGLHGATRPGDELLGRRVFFPVRTPVAEGRHRLRCSLYAQQVLVQSWVVSTEVRRGAAPGGAGADPQARERDFVLSRSLDPAALARLRPHRLSVMLNDNDEGTHGLRLLGEGGFKSSATFDVAELAEHGNQVRRALRRVACGVEEATDGQAPYRYDDRVDLDRLGGDLASLARRGYRVYSAIVHDLARGAPGEVGTADRLAELLRRPGRIQLCTRRNARHSLPGAAVYDRPFDDATPDIVLCPAFVDAVRTGAPLDATPCFRGECPTLGEPDVVCPSGFWGFRHAIGAPPSLGDGEDGPPEVPLEVATGDGLVVDVGVSTDPGFVCRGAHEDVLRALRPGLEWNYGDTRASVLKLLRTTQPDLVYFYCHGGIDEASGVPFIEVGPPGETPITGSNLLAYKVRWDESHPLVMVNGCHTTALGPQTPLELVSAFVEHSHAAGVVGTEITVFEPLACAFAEELLRRLLGEGLAVGEAVQQARLALLRRGNPLGLAYVAFAPGDLRFSKRPATVPTPAR